MGNACLLLIHTTSDTRRAICLPARTDVRDLRNGKTLGHNVDKLRLVAAAGKTFLYGIDR